MVLTNEIKEALDKAVLCWLATSDSDGYPNVSPKELFIVKDQYILIANIASPQSMKNIGKNPNVCLSILDILVQKGYKIKGTASILTNKNPDFETQTSALKLLAGERFPFKQVIKIDPTSVKPILAPSYLMYPESTTEEGQIESAKKQYGFL